MSLKHLSKDLTSYDLLKALAVLLMLADHIGYYFYPDDNSWRLVGRMCVPIWFFLIGYARSRDLGPRLWGGMIILVLASAVTGMGVIPLNILATMIVIRLLIDPVMTRSMQSSQTLWQLSLIFLFLIIPSSYLFEYGTLAVIMGMYGWLVRHRHEYPQGEIQLQRFFFFALGTFVFMQTIFFGFNQQEMVALFVGIPVVMGLLTLFKPVVFSGTGTGVKGVLCAPLRFMGRWTLEIYVAHLLVFKAIAATTQPERFHWFDWRLVPEAMLFTPSSPLS